MCVCVCAGVCARLWECEVPPGARYLFWPLAPLDSSEWTGRNFYPTQDLDAPHPTQCTVRVCAVCVCVRSSTIVRLCVCSVWCRGVCRVTCRYVHPPAAGTHRKKPKMGNRLSSCGPLIRKAYRHEDTPWQNSRKRDGHLLR